MSANGRDWEEFWTTHEPSVNGVYGPPNPSLLQHAQSFIGTKTGLYALDVACGDGRYTIPLAEMGYQVTALDITSTALMQLSERIRGRGLPITCEELNILDLLTQSRQYDLIICSGLLEELPIDRHAELIECLQRWTASNGINILRYVVEKRLSPETPGDIVVLHNDLRAQYVGWNIIDDSVEKVFRRASIGRTVGGVTINRFFQAASIIATKLDPDFKS